MKLKLLSAAATSTIAAIMLAPLQSASANECIVRDGNAAAIGLLQTDFEQLGLNLDNVSQQLALTQDRVDANTAGIAIANALSGSSWLQSNESTAFTANIGYYEGSTALAFSGAQRLNKNFSANVAVGVVPDRGDVGARAGVRLGW
ncbi:MAG: YadA C-terminal domain-containing protein [Henriciella sp.]